MTVDNKIDNMMDDNVIDTRLGYIGLILTVAFFHLINRFITYIGPPSSLSDRSKDEFWKWRNVVLSWIHALIVGSWDLSCFYFYPDLMDNLVTHITPYTYFLVVFSTGYFLYDFGDMAVHNKVFKMWELTLHHIAVTSMFFYNVATARCIGYNVVALLAEVNSFFLHTRKLLQMHYVSFSHWTYRSNAVLNIVSFAVCRGYALGRITYGMMNQKDRALVPTLYFYSLCFSMFIMNSLNPILFWILLKNDFLRKDYEKKPIKATKTDEIPAGDAGKPTAELHDNGNNNQNHHHSNGLAMNGHITSPAKLAASTIKLRFQNTDVAANIDANKIE